MPQLWNINHPDYNKHSSKQRNIQLLSQQLQEQYQVTLTTERLKQRLNHFKSQYRKLREQQQMQQLKCHNKNANVTNYDVEWYEKLKFLQYHVPPFHCNLCQIEFNIYKEYNKHRKGHCGQRRNGERNVALKGNSFNNVCDICGLTFTLRSNLMVHLKRHNGIRNYPCTKCPKRFFNSHTLKIHERSHTKEMPFTCEICGRSFYDKSKLSLHLKRHTNCRDFPCNYCTRAFFTAHERDYHIRRHLNIRDKVCKICGKTFVAGSALYAHIMIHNDVKKYACDKCDMKFAQYAGLYKHKKKHH